MNRMRLSSLAILLSCLLASGIAAMALFLGWTRAFGLGLGDTGPIVLPAVAISMAGLALGCRLFGHLAEHTGRPLLLYGVFGIGIGLFGLVVPNILSLVRWAFHSSQPVLAGKPSLSELFRYLLAAPVFLAPSLLMGGVLSAAVRWFVRAGQETGRATSLACGAIMLGSATGAVLGGYWALPSLGTVRTNLSAAVLSLMAGAVAILVSLWQESQEEEEGAGPDEHHASTLPLPHRRALLWSAALSGAAALTFSLTWIRTMALIIGPTIYSFLCVLVVVSVWFALGNILHTILFDRVRGVGGLALLYTSFAAGAALLLPLFHLLPQTYLALLMEDPHSFLNVQLGQLLLATGVIIFPAAFLGMAIPFTAGFVCSPEKRTGVSPGHFFSWSAWGAMTGSLLTGTFLIPVTGLQWSLMAGISCGIMAAGLVASAGDSGRSKTTMFAGAGLLALLALLPRWDQALMVSGYGVRPNSYEVRDEVLGPVPSHQRWQVLFFEEGAFSTTAVVRDRDGWQLLKVDGRTVASTEPGMLEAAVKLAYVPMILHPEPSHVALIGLGGGITAYTITRFDTPERVDIFQADRSEVTAQGVISPGELDATVDRRVRLIVQDGLITMASDGQTYDVVILNRPSVWALRTANFFTVDFFRAAKTRLAPGGLFCLRIDISDLALPDLRMIARSFLEVFPKAQFWENAYGTDYSLIGCQDDFPPLGLDALDARLSANPRLLSFLESQGERPAEALLGSFCLGPDEVAKLGERGPINTEDRNLLEFYAPRGLYQSSTSVPPELMQSTGHSVYPPFASDSRLMEPAMLLGMSDYLLQRGRAIQALRFIRRLPSLIPPPPAQTSQKEKIFHFPSGKQLIENFDRRTVIPFFPLAGGFRPDGLRSQEVLVWEAYQEYFSRISGIMKAAGPDGSEALRIRSPSSPMPLAFLFPIEVDPDAIYEVTFLLKSDSPADVDAGAGYMEYSTVFPYDETFTVERHDTLMLNGQVGVVVRGAIPWTRQSFSIRTGSLTRMVLIQLFRIGPASGGDVLFDSLAIRKVPAETGSATTH